MKDALLKLAAKDDWGRATAFGDIFAAVFLVLFFVVPVAVARGFGFAVPMTPSIAVGAAAVTALAVVAAAGVTAGRQQRR